MANGTVGKVTVVSQGGGVLVVLVTASPTSHWPNQWTCRFVSLEEGAGWRWHGPRYSSHTTTGNALNMPGTYRAVSLPYWLLTPTFCIVPVLWLWKRRKEKRRRGFEVEAKQEVAS